jgi:hypothetical protein
MEVNFESGQIRPEELEPAKRQLAKMHPDREDPMALLCVVCDPVHEPGSAPAAGRVPVGSMGRRENADTGGRDKRQSTRARVPAAGGNRERRSRGAEGGATRQYRAGHSVRL